MLFRVGTSYGRVDSVYHLEAVKVRRKSGSACLLLSLKLRGHEGKPHFVSVLFLGMTLGDLSVLFLGMTLGDLQA